jgi:dTDP-4-dehydrorhamnose reductase
MRKLLVTGASGFLGWNLCQLARKDWQIYGTYSRHHCALAQGTELPVDITDGTALKAIFSALKPDAVIHLAAQSQPNFCEENPDLSYQVNVKGTVLISQYCAEAHIPLVFTSTDLVFDGTQAPYVETAPVNPVNRYGEQKVKAEQFLQQIYPAASICRMPLMFGLPSPSSSSFIQPFIQQLKAGKTLSLFRDEWRSPVSAVTAAQGLLLALSNAPGQILHLGGQESVSRYQFGHLMAEIFNFPLAHITACSQGDVPMAAPRPQNVSLDSRKAYALGYAPPTLREELSCLKALLSQEIEL